MSEIVYYETNGKQQPLTEEQLKLLEAAEKQPIVYDEDSPKLTPAMIKSFRCSAAYRNRQRQIKDK